MINGTTAVAPALVSFWIFGRKNEKAVVTKRTSVEIRNPQAPKPDKSQPKDAVPAGQVLINLSRFFSGRYGFSSDGLDIPFLEKTGLIFYDSDPSIGLLLNDDHELLADGKPVGLIKRDALFAPGTKAVRLVQSGCSLFIIGTAADGTEKTFEVRKKMGTMEFANIVTGNNLFQQVKGRFDLRPQLFFAENLVSFTGFGERVINKQVSEKTRRQVCDFVTGSSESQLERFKPFMKPENIVLVLKTDYPYMQVHVYEGLREKSRLAGTLEIRSNGFFPLE
jgi:hypothetical protein